MADSIKLQLASFQAQPDRSLAYSNLLHLFRLISDDPSSMHALSLSSPPLIPIILSEIQSHNEEIASQGLKCLGFMLYHPSLVTVFSGEVGGLVLDSLVKVIVGTKMKAVCNLGIWCMSIGQLAAEVVGERLDVLVSVVVYGIDNPFGSVSITFEAMQAVTKLATQFHEQMRITSYIWAPPIYRRLISNDKKERDMAQRCLFNTKLIICPPSSSLSKTLNLDLKEKLLPSMFQMLHNCQLKLQMVQAWGWYICLLSSGSLKIRNIINEMLKIPEHTFTDPDPQVQIATLVAWEQLVDLLLPCGIDLEMDCDDQVNGLLKRIKVLIKPLQGIISSKCDISVRSSCIRTWHYLLHKLDLSVNHPSVLMTCFWPIYESMFSKGIACALSISLWTSFFNLLDDYILSKVTNGETKVFSKKSPCFILDQVTVESNKCLMKDCPIKWLPWKICNLEFLLKTISNIVGQFLVVKSTPEERKLAFSYSLKIFRSVLWGVEVEIKRPSTCNKDIMCWVTTILKFAKDVCEDEALRNCANQCNEFLCLAFKFVESVRVEMNPLIVVSPIFQVSLDLKYIKDLQLPENMDNILVAEPFRVKPLVYMDMVSPMVYTTILVLCTMAQSFVDLSISNINDYRCGIEHIKYLLFSADPLPNLHASTSFLYTHLGKPVNGGLQWVKLWRIIGKGMLDMTGSLNGLSYSNCECDGANCTLVSQFLCYPYIMLLHQLKVSVSNSASYCSDSYMISSRSEIELEVMMGIWNSLFDCLSSGSLNKLSSISNYSECLSEMLMRTLDENTMIAIKENESPIWNSQRVNFFLVFGDLVVCILDHAQVLDSETSGCKVINQEFVNQNRCSPIRNSFGLVSRFMEVSVNVMEKDLQAAGDVVCRVLAALTGLIGHIFLQEDILFLMELISNPLISWFYFCTSISDEMEHSSIIYQLECLWKQILDCLQNSQPPIVFDSSFIGVQASLLQVSLDHPHPPISDAAIAFWKATYNQNVDLVYPQCLLPILDKLSKGGRISLHQQKTVTFASKGFSVKEVTELSHRRIVGVNTMDRPNSENVRKSRFGDLTLRTTEGRS